jgi:phosphatidylinositol-3-phosphatase
MTRKAALFALLMALSIAGCGGAVSSAKQGPVQTAASPRAHTQRGRPAHIAVIVMENEEYSSIIGASSAPYINALARRYALSTAMYAIRHPSLPNYLALTGGSTFGITSDCTSCAVGATSLVDQLSRARVSWKAYVEDLPGRCFTGGDAGEYAKKHNPFVYYTRVTRDRSRCAKVVSLNRLYRDERAHSLPTFIWITPNLCHDMHDCSTATGDRFLAGLVPRLLRALGRNGLLFLTWDEGSSDAGCCRLAAGGHITTIVAGAAARPGARMRTPADHYSLLQTIEDVLGLPRLRGAACRCTPSLQPLLRGRG